MLIVPTSVGFSIYFSLFNATNNDPKHFIAQTWETVWLAQIPKETNKQKQSTMASKQTPNLLWPDTKVFVVMTTSQPCIPDCLDGSSFDSEGSQITYA